MAGEMSDDNRVTPLHDRHVALGARMIPFAGWMMPVQYSGIIDEHNLVRTKAGLFDLGHMGQVDVTGPDALAFLQKSPPTMSRSSNRAGRSTRCSRRHPAA
ncbi:MAG: hypothetical protein R2845_08635 [Thermomicrobiales bacterium]